jgi:hypothetical protein
MNEALVASAAGTPRRLAPLTLFTVDVELQRIVDLTQDDVLRALDVAHIDLTTAWRPVILAGGIPLTHEIGAAARAAGIEALRYPSARAPGTANLAIIVDRLQRESVLRINPSDGFAPTAVLELHGTR